MPVPNRPLGCPPGLEYLIQVNNSITCDFNEVSISTLKIIMLFQTILTQMDRKIKNKIKTEMVGSLLV